ncbi:hypothetical protein [Lysinibacillus boronitolerans]|uniref:Pre-toxin TG domain-containing protein n=1 Tax=Lysinibacillus boronitolerans JCM 21713 = 10a = NBRC 103108 TaxID=1294264 RepID=A0ABR4Y538_9BACI|nr:hypothetical protein [Lysinibacillus boronitolerans]KGR89600.1 hypothetical protein CD31_00385 [Lysinibacillus boronitolerans JCM 21713 = 10a = NBRC 103108]
MVPVVGEVADGVNGIIYAARGDKVNAATAGKWVNKGAKAAKGISESAQKANKGLLGNVKEKVNKQVANAKTQIQSKVDEVKQQLRQLRPPEMELAGAGVNVRRIEDTGTVGRNTTTPSPKPSNSQPPQNGSNKKPDENKGTGNNSKNVSRMNFGSTEKLESHFGKHGGEFGGAYSNANEYLAGANNVIENGIKVQYEYKGELRTGYVKFMKNSGLTNAAGVPIKSYAKFEFVGTNNLGEITTYHVESGKTFWKMMNNGENIPVINPVE